MSAMAAISTCGIIIYLRTWPLPIWPTPMIPIRVFSSVIFFCSSCYVSKDELAKAQTVESAQPNSGPSAISLVPLTLPSTRSSPVGAPLVGALVRATTPGPRLPAIHRRGTPCGCPRTRYDSRTPATRQPPYGHPLWVPSWVDNITGPQIPVRTTVAETYTPSTRRNSAIVFTAAPSSSPSSGVDSIPQTPL